MIRKQCEIMCYLTTFPIKIIRLTSTPPRKMKPYGLNIFNESVFLENKILTSFLFFILFTWKKTRGKFSNDTQYIFLICRIPHNKIQNPVCLIKVYFFMSIIFIIKDFWPAFLCNVSSCRAFTQRFVEKNFILEEH